MTPLDYANAVVWLAAIVAVTFFLNEAVYVWRYRRELRRINQAELERKLNQFKELIDAPSIDQDLT